MFGDRVLSAKPGAATLIKSWHYDYSRLRNGGEGPYWPHCRHWVRNAWRPAQSGATGAWVL